MELRETHLPPSQQYFSFHNKLISRNFNSFHPVRQRTDTSPTNGIMLLELSSCTAYSPLEDIKSDINTFWNQPLIMDIFAVLELSGHAVAEGRPEFANVIAWYL